MSKTLPCRTLATPAMPSDLSAPSIALPCGSRMPDLRVAVMRAFIAFPARVDMARTRSPPARSSCLEVYEEMPSMHRGDCRLLEQPPAARDMAALADEPQRRPKRRLRARDDGNAVARFERLRHVQCA